MALSVHDAHFLVKIIFMSLWLSNSACGNRSVKLPNACYLLRCFSMYNEFKQCS